MNEDVEAGRGEGKLFEQCGEAEEEEGGAFKYAL